ncbi:MAG: hypothetical protein HDQ88_07655 [Clostridia bacterium]|nr:hypothetical protein [Clostridia bacterium]
MKIKHYILILLAIVATPIIVNFILYSNNPISNWLPTVGLPSEWIGFWGNVAGNILGGLIVLIVLHYTLKENVVLRETQIKTIKYTQQQTWLDNLRQQLIGNYNMLDMQSLSIALYKLQQGEYGEAQISLLSLNRNVEFQANSSSLYFLNDNLFRAEQEYIDSLKRIMTEYGCLVNDSIFFTSILPYLSTKPNMPVMTNEDIVKLAKSSYNAVIESSMHDTETQNYYSENSILPIIMTLDFRDTEFLSKFNELFLEHYQKFSIVHARKYELIRCTENVLRYEEHRINQILE